jgi:iron complex transport system substrate-binding protein
VESILLMRPDLVLATTAGDDPRTIARLTSLGVRVLTVDVTSCERLAAACNLVERVAVEDPSGTLGRSLAARCAAVDRLAASLPPRSALYVVWWDPLIVAAPGTFHDDMLRRVRLTNLAPAGAGRYPRVDPELLLDPRLEVVVAPDEPDVRAGFGVVLARPEGFRMARGEARVIWLPADQASRPGPRLVDAMERLLADRMTMEAAR